MVSRRRETSTAARADLARGAFDEAVDDGAVQRAAFNPVLHHGTSFDQRCQQLMAKLDVLGRLGRVDGLVIAAEHTSDARLECFLDQILESLVLAAFGEAGLLVHRQLEACSGGILTFDANDVRRNRVDRDVQKLYFSTIRPIRNGPVGFLPRDWSDFTDGNGLRLVVGTYRSAGTDES